MSMSVDIPADLQPLLQAAIANGRYANEQELVTEVLRLTIPALEGYEQMRHDVQTSCRFGSSVSGHSDLGVNQYV